MPRTSKVDFDQILKVLTERKDDIIDKETKLLKSPKDTCWNDIINQFNFKISPKYLRLIIKENRHDILTKLKLTLNVCIQSDQKDIGESESSEESSGDNNDLNNKSKLIFKITLSKEQWESIYDSGNSQDYKRSNRKSKNRKYHILKPYEWSPIIQNYFYALTKLPCYINYKNAKVYLNGEIFLKINGKCTVCLSNFQGVVIDQPLSIDIVTIDCTYQGDFGNCKSSAKRKLIGNEREQLKNKLTKENQSAADVRSVEAMSVMEYGDKEPSNLPSTNALRILRHKALKEEQVNSDPVIALSILKGDSPYNNIIHNISYDKFFVHYWASTEINSYRLYAKNTDVPRISIDATGGVVRSPTLISGRKISNIFLYQIGVRDQKNCCQFAVGHMLSEKHDHNIISYWLSEWLRSKIPSPKIIITNQSLAVMMAVTKAFTQYSYFSKYISVCSSLILKEPGVEIPLAMIRNDFNHIMHLLSSWPVIKQSTYKIKHFYLQSIGLIIASTDYTDIKLLLTHIFTVCLYETDGLSSCKQLTKCEISKTYLKQRIATHEIELNECLNSEETEDNKYNEDDTDVIAEDSNMTSIFLEFKLIFENVKNEAENDDVEGDHDNVQFNPSIANKLLDFCKLIPTWSAVMVPIFNYGNITETSATSENLFNDLKTNVFKHESLPLRIDQFLKIHVNSIIGSMNIIRDKKEIEYDNYLVDKEEEVIYDNLNEFNLEIEKNDSFEDWRGFEKQIKIKNDSCDDTNELNNIPNKLITHINLKNDPAVLFYNDRSKTKSTILGILKNGNISDHNPVNIDGFSYILRNTCAFDSLVHLICSSYADSKQYSTYIDQEISHDFFNLVSSALRDGINTQTYRKRVVILNKIMPTLRTWHEHSSGLRIFDCSCTIEFMVQNIFTNYPSLATIEKCLNCSFTKERKMVTISVKLLTENINCLNDALLSMFLQGPRACKKCNIGNIELVNEYGKQIFIEPYIPLTAKQNIESLNISVALHEIPKTITVQQLYNLRGIINFVPPASKKLEAVGHYITYCWRNETTEWEEYDDLSTSPKIVRPNSIDTNCQILVYTI